MVGRGREGGGRGRIIRENMIDEAAKIESQLILFYFVRVASS